MTPNTIGFIGFGEAAFQIAKGLRQAGLKHTLAYDINRTLLVESRARETDTTLVNSPLQLAESSSLLFSLVTATSALQAAMQTAPFLRSQHVYVDFNSVSPASKQAIEARVRRSKAQFIEASIMAPVSPYQHRVPILMTGVGCADLAAELSRFGMCVEVLEGNTGAAAAVKMCRSIVVKGLEALLFESMRAASIFGAEERVLQSLNETFPGMDWSTLASYMIGRVVVHGERRAHEMEEVAETLRSINVEPIMSEAAARLQAWTATRDFKSHFGPEGPEHYSDVMDVLLREESALHE